LPARPLRKSNPEARQGGDEWRLRGSFGLDVVSPSRDGPIIDFGSEPRHAGEYDQHPRSKASVPKESVDHATPPLTKLASPPLTSPQMSAVLGPVGGFSFAWFAAKFFGCLDPLCAGVGRLISQTDANLNRSVYFSEISSPKVRRSHAHLSNSFSRLRRFSALTPPLCRPDSGRAWTNELLSNCRDDGRSQLWSYLCVRRLVGDRKRDLQRSWVSVAWARDRGPRQTRTFQCHV
jgi:hypothetical protein